MNKDLIFEELKKEIAPENILKDEEMKKHTTYKIGGAADIFVKPQSIDEIAHIIKTARNLDVPYYIIGRGSNLLVSDEGYRGIIVYLGNNFSSITIEGDEIQAESGASLIQVARKAYQSGLTGMEFACGIPGTIGGAVCMNAGSFNGEIKDILIEIDALDEFGEKVVVKNGELKMTYRKTVISEKKFTVVGARFKLQKGNTEEMKETMELYDRKRQASQPLDMPNAGSVFKRPEGHFPGKLIDEVGLKGYKIGGAQISEKHANFIVNTGEATAKDVMMLADHAKKMVLEKTGVELEFEIKVIGDIK